MRYVTDFTDYELIDAAGGERLERWGDIILRRPDPQVIWEGDKENRLWNSAHAVYHRSNSGGGRWEMLKKVPDVWSIQYGDLCFRLKPMGFKHTGLFPEQAVNWTLLSDVIKKSDRPLKVLNLFAYTGGATVAALAAGAAVTHVDASKGMVQWAKENAAASGLQDLPVRWLVDDCLKFIRREIRRQNNYDIIIMDPPSYGRGPGGEVWKFENGLSELLTLTSEILSPEAKLLLINCYTTGMSPTIMNYMTRELFSKGRGGTVFTDEIGLKITYKELVLPCGSTTVWKAPHVE